MLRTIFAFFAMLLLVPQATAYELNITAMTKTGETEFNVSTTIQYHFIFRKVDASAGTANFSLSYAIMDSAGSIVRQSNAPISMTITRSEKKSDTYQWTPKEGGTYAICGTIENVPNETQTEDNSHCISIVVIGGEPETPRNETQENVPAQNSTAGANETHSNQTDETIDAEEPAQEPYLRIRSVSSRRPHSGDVITVTLEGHKGETNKYALYLSVETKEGRKISDEISVHVREKNSGFLTDASVQLDSGCFGEDSYWLVAHGLDLSARKEIFIESAKDCSENEEKEPEKTMPAPVLPALELVLPKSVETETAFTVYAVVRNRENNTATYVVYGYSKDGNEPITAGYNGEKWKGGWTANKQEVVLMPGELSIVPLQSMFESGSAGTQTYKIVAKGSKKYESEKTILVLKGENKTKKESDSLRNVTTTNTSNALTGRAIYAKKEGGWFSSLKRVFSILFT